jgi:DNA polymerase V
VVQIARVVIRAQVQVPIFGSAVCAGFPSPAEDWIEERIDPAALLIANRPATFLMRVDGPSMVDVGIFDKDIVVVDRSLGPRHGDVVVAVVDGERSLKSLDLSGAVPRLSFANAALPTFAAAELSDALIWGVVTWNLHRLRAR